MVYKVRFIFETLHRCCILAMFLAVVCGIALIQCIVNGNPDEIVDLPGLPSKPNFHQYSGYLNATNGRLLHYWFVESERDPSNDPLLLWLNGGPGCSSLDGLLTEHGPFRVAEQGKSLSFNPYSWNKLTNVVYLEAPAGVGFSYSLDKNYKTNDDQVSLDNYVALQSFFKKFPQFTKNEFYITGESYGGIYVPTLSVRVLQGSAPINFKGFAVGNGLSSSLLNDNSIIFFIYHHGLFGIGLWTELTKYCCSGGVSQSTCNFHNSTDERCRNAVTKAMSIIMSSGLNPYNLYDICQTTDTSKGQFTRFDADIKSIFKYYGFSKSMLLRKAKSKHGLDPPCISGADTTAYLNRPDVRTALHIPDNVQNWTVCSEDVATQYVTLYKTMENQYNILLPKVRGLVYNGDVDMMCNFLGDEWFVDSLGRKVISNYTYWKIDNQVGGFVKQFDSLDFLTIRGAGHMVPTNKPQEALKMITSFLFKKPY
uniref:Carboxypeptidase n=1 Tax=Hemiscolopendra marginata TaxID=943146 RepID=A0A646QCJ4_9MYRI